MKTILVTGANGQLGSALRRLSASLPDTTFLFTDVDTLDICDAHAVMAYVKKHQPGFVLNCAAYTAVDRAEDDEALALRINCDAVRNLGEAAREVSARMIHISTDYVFDGTNCRPYQETDAPCPVSAYGRTKLAGEQTLMQVCPDSIIIRTAWLYSEYGNNFVKTMLRLGAERDMLRVIFDQVGTPTYAGDLAQTMIALVRKAEEGLFVPGTYHYTNEGVCSWYDFTVKILELAALTCRVEPIETKDYPTRAIRPHYSVLNKTKLKETYHFPIPHWEESLRGVVRELSAAR